MTTPIPHTAGHRLPNFSAGPASIPTPVLATAQQELLNWQGMGLSVMEMSHRSADFMAVAERAEQQFRDLLGIPDTYRVLFLQGGASLQFSALALNLMNGRHADYLDTGTWSAKAIKEAQRYAALGLGEVNVVASGADSNYQDVPKQANWQLSKQAAYFHYCSNETIHGVQIFEPPKIDAPVVVDMSSCILSQPINVSDYDMIYAGAQKNIGPAGLVLVIIKESLLGHASDWCPLLLNYQHQAQKQSMSNTPPTFSWYLAGLVFDWLQEQGGLSVIGKRNQCKAQLLYECIDASALYHNHVNPAHRSIMNVPFSLSDPSLDTAFLSQAKQAGLLNLKGHRSVGGMRASIYNAVELSWVEQLVDFMRQFERQY